MSNLQVTAEPPLEGGNRRVAPGNVAARLKPKVSSPLTWEGLDNAQDEKLPAWRIARGYTNCQPASQKLMFLSGRVPTARPAGTWALRLASLS